MAIYQPEMESFDGNTLEVRSAFNYYDGTGLPIFGALWLRAKVHIDKANNKVLFDNIEMVDANFPDVSSAKKAELSSLLRVVSPEWQFNTDLSNFMKIVSSKTSDDKSSQNLKNNPPNIFYEEVYSELIFIDGPPILENVDNSELYQYVANTPYFIVRSSSDKFYYLKAGEFWFRAKDIYYDWITIDNPPQAILSLAKRSEEHNPLIDSDLNKLNSSKPKLLLSIDQAELIQTHGEPDKSLIQGTRLYHITNSPNNLLYDDIAELYYVLLSGRWYRSATLKRGNWSFVEPSELPVYFKKLPQDITWARFRVSIPGTPEAMNAALDNGIPQTAIIDRVQAKIYVEYDGEPEFKPIEGTALQYAINTNLSIIKVSDTRFYAVDEGVWFTSDSAKENWKVATELPAEINNIPPSVPVYNVRFVHIYEASDDYVYVGYTGGYTGSFLYQGCLFYGTGYQYTPWYKSKYYSRPTTFAFGVNRTPSKSNVTVSVGVGYGYGYGYPGFYSPYGYGSGFGSYNYATLNGNYEYKKGYEQKPLDQSNIYNNRTQGIIATETVRRNDPYKVLPPPEQQTRDGSWIPPTNLYTSSDGNVYKKDDDGNWHKRSDGAWVRTKESNIYKQ